MPGFSGLFEFTVAMKDGVSPLARKAQEAIDVLSKQIRENRDAVLGMNQAMRHEQAMFRAMINPTEQQIRLHKLNLGVMRDEKAEMLARNQRLYMERARIEDVTKSMLLNGRAALGMGDAMKQLVTGDVGGGLSKLAGALKGSGERMSSLGMAAVGVAGAFAALAGITVGLAFEGEKLAVEASEEKERFLDLFDAMGEGETNGRELIGYFDLLREQLGETRGEMGRSARDFEAMGLRALPDLKDALTASASAAAMMGQEGADAFRTMMSRIAEAEEATGGFLKMNVGRRNPFAAMGVDIKDVAAQMGVTSTELGAALKAGTADASAFGTALEAAITQKGAKSVDRMSHSLEAVSKRGKENLSTLFEDVNVRPLTDGLGDIVSLFDKSTISGKNLHDAITWAFGGAAKTIGDFVESAAVSFIDFGTWMIKLRTGVLELEDWFIRSDWEGAGVAVIKGIARGMYVGLGFIGDATIWIADETFKSFKNAFMINSPSKLTMPIGVGAVEGIGAGAEEEQKKYGAGGIVGDIAYQASSYANDMPTVPVAAPANVGGSRTAAPKFEVTIVLTGTSPEAVAAEISEESLALIWERVSAAGGA